MTPADMARTAALGSADASDMGVDSAALERLYARIEGHIADGRYPGAAVAMARYGKLVGARVFGLARYAADGESAILAENRTMWPLYSQTKPIVSCAIWQLVEHGRLRFHDTVAEYLPEFAAHGKGKVTLYQLLTHQAGFPSATVPPEAREDKELLRETVCNFTLEWEPGSRVVYSSAGHWVQAVLIEVVTGQDYRNFVREQITAPLELNRLWVGVPNELHDDLAFIYKAATNGALESIPDENDPEHWRAGLPGSGGYSTATDMAAFYQMLLGFGALNGTRIICPRTVQYVTRNHTGERVDETLGMPMHRGLGVHVRGSTATIRGLGSVASPNTFGHGGVGTSYSWADPETGVSFSYLSNGRIPEPWHSQRLDEIANLAHAAVVDLSL